MAVCRSVVNLALRKLGKLGAGREPRLADTTDAFEGLKGLYTTWVASGAFGRLHDIQPRGPEYTARVGQRITRESEALVRVILPEVASDDRPIPYDYGWNCRRSAHERTTPIDGSAVVIVSLDTGATQTWLFDGTRKQWQQVTALQIDDEAPRSSADHQGLAACLAEELADQFGADLAPTTIAQAARFKTAMTTGFGFEDRATVGVYI